MTRLLDAEKAVLLLLYWCGDQYSDYLRKFLCFNGSGHLDTLKILRIKGLIKGRPGYKRGWKYNLSIPGAAIADGLNINIRKARGMTV